MWVAVFYSIKKRCQSEKLPAPQSSAWAHIAPKCGVTLVDIVFHSINPFVSR